MPLRARARALVTADVGTCVRPFVPLSRRRVRRAPFAPEHRRHEPVNPHLLSIPLVFYLPPFLLPSCACVSPLIPAASWPARYVRGISMISTWKQIYRVPLRVFRRRSRGLGGRLGIDHGTRAMASLILSYRSTSLFFPPFLSIFVLLPFLARVASPLMRDTLNSLWAPRGQFIRGAKTG